jgi:hypothetical protein
VHNYRFIQQMQTGHECVLTRWIYLTFIEVVVRRYGGAARPTSLRRHAKSRPHPPSLNQPQEVGSAKEFQAHSHRDDGACLFNLNCGSIIIVYSAMYC